MYIYVYRFLTFMIRKLVPRSINKFMKASISVLVVLQCFYIYFSNLKKNEVTGKSVFTIISKKRYLQIVRREEERVSCFIYTLKANKLQMFVSIRYFVL